MVNAENWKMEILGMQNFGEMKKRCRCFCVMCKYYEMCKEDELLN